MKIRVKYAKTGALRYISHLDVMRYFQKAIRRAGLDVAYSQGYSPHQLITFAAPLGLGVTSEGEYFDAEMNAVTSSDDMCARLNAVMASGMRVLAVTVLKDGAKTAMVSVAASDYRITLRDGYSLPEDFFSSAEDFYRQPRIDVVKVSKTREIPMDIKPLIYRLEAERGALYLLLSAGSIDHLKPDLVLEAFCRYRRIEYQKLAFRIHRLETYMRNEAGELVSLLEAGERIE